LPSFEAPVLKQGLRPIGGGAISPHMPTALVTGANRGIGLALTRALLQRKYTVIAACRTPSDALLASGAEVVSGIDVSNSDAIDRLATAVGQRPIDLLINNAGILVWGDRLESLNVDGIRQQFEVNALGPLLVTAALRNNLKRGAKVALITSRMGSIEDNGSGGAYGYRLSKAALNMVGKSLAVDLAPAGVAVAILHPGMVKTEMIGNEGQFTPEEAASGLLQRIDDLEQETSGGFWHQNGERLPW
jgi:NAD(P)-dependent dehydrogenase (short-subunit alcohol dehydrogenase family)